MPRWGGFGADFDAKNAELKSACFAHFDQDRDGFLNRGEFHNLCSDLFTIDGKDHVVSKDDSAAMMKCLVGHEEDGRIGEKQFKYCWEFWLNQILAPKTALMVVDVQNDFIDGSLALCRTAAKQDGAEVVPIINKLLDLEFDVVVYTKDYHPTNHLSFFENLNLRKLHPSCKVKAEDAKMFDTVVFDMEPLVDQILWPTHCVQGTKGAEYHPDLKVVKNHLVHLKGTDPDVESYSVFVDNTKQVNHALVKDMKARGITDIYVCGLAYDFCVGMTAMDAISFGYRTMVIEDASRGTCHEKIAVTKQRMLQAGGVIGRSSEVPAMLSKRTRCPKLGLVAARIAAEAMKTRSRSGNGDSNADLNSNLIKPK